MKILIIQADNGHAMMIKKNLNATGINHPIEIVKEPGKIEAILSENRGLITMIMDLDLPDDYSLNLLREIKSSRYYYNSIVIIFTNSSNPEDIKRCYQSGCNIYITKPVDYGDFADTIKGIGMFLQMTKLP